MKINKKDKVVVIYGKDNGRKGVVEKVYPKTNTALIPGINIFKKHIKKNEKMPQGGKVDLPRPIAISKIMLICPKCGKQTRVGIKIENKKKFRICKKCQSKI